MKSAIRLRFWVLAVGFLLAAVLQHFWFAPLNDEIPAAYLNETFYNAKSRHRSNPEEEWQNIDLIARRRDQTLVNHGDVAVIQGDLHWYSNSDEVIFENAGLYGVDRRTRMNVTGFGNVGRSGYFLFPLHLEQTSFSYMDPMFVGQRIALFDHTEELNGLTVYVFHFTGINMDETEGYSHLQLVPEKYQVLTNGQGKLWIEPLTGILVDYEEQGISYFVDPVNHKHIASFYEWNDRYTPETKAKQIAQVGATRLRILWQEVWLPVGLLLIGAGFLLSGVFSELKRRRTGT